MTLESTIQLTAQQAITNLYHTNLPLEQIVLQETRKEFEGQITLVTFPIVRLSKKSPEQTGLELGEYLQKQIKEIAGFNVIKGFLNLSITDSYWTGLLEGNILNPAISLICFCKYSPSSRPVCSGDFFDKRTIGKVTRVIWPSNSLRVSCKTICSRGKFV
jgi:hypothetical protein